MSTSETIELENIGPITRLSLPCPKEGGLVVLRGRNGSGKTTALEAISAAAGSKAKLTPRDGELKGKLEGLGISMTVAQSIRRRGELDVLTLEGKFSVADLVEPGLASPEAADAKRIKALVQLAGAEAKPAMFHALVGGQKTFEQFVRSDLGDDLVSMARKVKDDLDKAARKEEEEQAHAEGHAAGCKEAIKDVDLEAPADERKLRDDVELAIQQQARIEADLGNYRKVQKAAADARTALAKAEQGYAGPSVADASADFTAKESASGKTHNEIVRIKRELAEAEMAHARSIAAQELAASVLKGALAHQKAIQAWQEQIDHVGNVPEIDADELAGADYAVEQARAADHLGVKVREARRQKAQIDAYTSQAEDHARKAGQLRQAAKGTDDVLSETVAKLGTKLTVLDGRLTIKTGRGQTYFSDLSLGERWKLALDIAIEAVGPKGMLEVDEAFEHLDPTHRQLIAEHVKGRGTLVFVTEPDDGELRAQLYEPAAE